MTHKRMWSASTLITLVSLVALLAVPGSFAAPASQDPLVKIDPQVLAATADGGTTEFLVVMAEQADLSAADQLPTKIEKGRYVFNTLYSHAQRTQAGVKAYLDAQGVSYRSYYSANVLKVGGDRNVLVALAARADVNRISANPHARVDLPKPSAVAPESADAIEWNVLKVNADDVWALGYEGQGMVVADADTGVQWNHPALKNQYRGWNGVAADHNYNWWDAIEQRPSPIDPYGHGTHTMGTIVGDDGGNNQIGVAPGAKWIACRNMDSSGTGSPSSYIECMDFTLAPWDLNQQNPNPDLAPHVINNSWYCPTSEGCTDYNILLAPVESLRAAGIVYVASAGNSGPSCATVSEPPAMYDASTSVGATTRTDKLASFSSKGPVTRDGSRRLKPDIVAPGENVRSSYPTNTYAVLSGTSMAGPHVVGGVALLWNARPELIGDVDGTEAALFNGAWRTLPPPQRPRVCGGTPYNVYPNNIYGWGRLDVLASLSASPVMPVRVP